MCLAMSEEKVRTHGVNAQKQPRKHFGGPNKVRALCRGDRAAAAAAAGAQGEPR